MRKKLNMPKRVPTAIPRGAAPGTRLLKVPRPCGFSDMARATRGRIPPCMRAAFFTVADGRYRTASCRFHLTAPARCWWVLKRPRAGHHRCRRLLSPGRGACPVHYRAYTEMMTSCQ